MRKRRRSTSKNKRRRKQQREGKRRKLKGKKKRSFSESEQRGRDLMRSDICSVDDHSDGGNVVMYLKTKRSLVDGGSVRRMPLCASTASLSDKLRINSVRQQSLQKGKAWRIQRTRNIQKYTHTHTHLPVTCMVATSRKRTYSGDSRPVTPINTSRNVCASSLLLEVAMSD